MRRIVIPPHCRLHLKRRKDFPSNSFHPVIEKKCLVFTWAIRWREKKYILENPTSSQAIMKITQSTHTHSEPGMLEDFWNWWSVLWIRWQHFKNQVFGGWRYWCPFWCFQLREREIIKLIFSCQFFIHSFRVSLIFSKVSSAEENNNSRKKKVERKGDLFVFLKWMRIDFKMAKAQLKEWTLSPGAIGWFKILQSIFFLLKILIVYQHTVTRPRAMASCKRRPDPLKGSLPESNTCNIIPAPHTSHALPYCRLVRTSGAM